MLWYDRAVAGQIDRNSIKLQMVHGKNLRNCIVNSLFSFEENAFPKIAQIDHQYDFMLDPLAGSLFIEKLQCFKLRVEADIRKSDHFACFSCTSSIRFKVLNSGICNKVHGRMPAYQFYHLPVRANAFCYDHQTATPLLFCNSGHTFQIIF